MIDEDDYADQHKQEVMASAKLLYGMIHARYIITANGLNTMVARVRMIVFLRSSTM